MEEVPEALATLAGWDRRSRGVVLFQPQNHVMLVDVLIPDPDFHFVRVV